jgi:hypothetical protein
MPLSDTSGGIGKLLRPDALSSMMRKKDKEVNKRPKQVEALENQMTTVTLIFFF